MKVTYHDRQAYEEEKVVEVVLRDAPRGYIKEI